MGNKFARISASPSLEPVVGPPEWLPPPVSGISSSLEIVALAELLSTGRLRLNMHSAAHGVYGDIHFGTLRKTGDAGGCVQVCAKEDMVLRDGLIQSEDQWQFFCTRFRRDLVAAARTECSPYVIRYLAIATAEMTLLDTARRVIVPKYLIMERGGRTLKEWLANNGPDGVKAPTDIRTQFVSLLVCVLRGLQHLHSGGVMHRDIKPANVLLNVDDEWTAKIIDLGLARRSFVDGPNTVDDSQLSGCTPYFMSPEFRSTASQGSVDVWAVGILAAGWLYAEQHGRKALKAVGSMDVSLEVQWDLFRRAADACVDDALARFVARCLAAHAADRPTAADCVALLGVKERPHARAVAVTLTQQLRADMASDQGGVFEVFVPSPTQPTESLIAALLRLSLMLSSGYAVTDHQRTTIQARNIVSTLEPVVPVHLRPLYIVARTSSLLPHQSYNGHTNEQLATTLCMSQDFETATNDNKDPRLQLDALLLRARAFTIVKEHGKALAAFEAAEAIVASVFPSRFGTIATCAFYKGKVLLAARRPVEALASFDVAIEAYTRAGIASQAAIARIAKAQVLIGLFSGDSLRSALALCQAGTAVLAITPHHESQYAVALSKQSSALEHLGALQAALDCINLSIALHKQHEGREDASVGANEDQRSRLLVRMRRWDEALAAKEAAIAHAQVLRLPASQITQQKLMCAFIVHQRNRSQEERAQALLSYRQMLPEGQDGWMGVITRLQYTEMLLNYPEHASQALELLDDIAREFVERYGSSHPQVAVIWTCQVACLIALDGHENMLRAETLCTAALDILTSHFDESHHYVREARRLWEAMGQTAGQHESPLVDEA
jgi:serine/threonine protein kinase/tetratricopeptide (TPR) repeat protein